MTEWLKIRVGDGEYQAWKAYAGHRGLSRFVRDTLNAELRRVEAFEGQRRGEVALSESLSARPTPPARVLDAQIPAESAVRPVEKCRHGLENCRICQTGLWARDVEPSTGSAGTP